MTLFLYRSMSPAGSNPLPARRARRRDRITSACDLTLTHLISRSLTDALRLSHSDDMYAPESIELLVKSGINFKRHDEYGISVEAFGELLISSGLVLLEEVQWVSFHS